MLIKQFFSVSDLQKKYSLILNQIEESQEPAYILKNNKPLAVMLSAQEFESMQTKLKEFETQESLQAVAEYEKEKKAGKLKPFTSIQDILDAANENN